MRRLLPLLLVVLPLLACGEKPKPLSEPGEKLYPVRGVIVSRNTGANSVRLDHEAIPGFMEAMVMDYEVRGPEVSALPPDKSRIQAKLHVTSRAYWITDIEKVP